MGCFVYFPHPTFADFFLYTIFVIKQSANEFVLFVDGEQGLAVVRTKKQMAFPFPLTD
jgi:hypothetical protein